MGQKSKTPKGEISITNFQGRIRLRWRYNGVRYSLNVPYAYVSENMHHGAIRAAEIKLDIAKGCFDPTLEKYNPTPLVLPPPKAEMGPVLKRSDGVTVSIIDLIKHFNDWGTNVRNIDIDRTTYYLAARSFLEKCKGVPLEQLPLKLNQENWSVSTYNERLSLLKNFFCG
jgi:integrase